MGGGGGASQGKWCFQAPETQFFQNGLQSGVSFFLKRRLFVSAIVFHSLYRFRVEGQKRLAYATCVRVFFRKRRKNLRCQNFWIRVDMNEA